MDVHHLSFYCNFLPFYNRGNLWEQSSYLYSDKSNSLDQEIVVPVAFSLINMKVPVVLIK